MQTTCVVLYGYRLACLPLLYFSHHLIKVRLSENVFEHKVCLFFSLQFLSEIFLILRRIQQDIVINVHRSLFKVPVILVGF